MLGGIAFVVIATTFYDPKDRPPEPPNPFMQRKLDELAVQRSVKVMLRDPESATFRHVTLRCGYVNAKNGFGGYTGDTRFIANPDADAVIETEDNHARFDPIWRKNC